MWDYLQHLSYWDWLALGTILLILEVFGAGGYLLWVGMAAAAVGVIGFVIPTLSWALQFVLFGVLSVLTAVFWWKRQRSNLSTSDQPGLNVPGQQLLGRVLVVSTAISGGRGKVQVGDSVWLAQGPDAQAGTRVKVTGIDGTVLQVTPGE
jgi:membrane protein implicated in regulation of membrane protease activity